MDATCAVSIQSTSGLNRNQKGLSIVDHFTPAKLKETNALRKRSRLPDAAIRKLHLIEKFSHEQRRFVINRSIRCAGLHLLGIGFPGLAGFGPNVGERILHLPHVTRKKMIERIFRLFQLLIRV